MDNVLIEALQISGIGIVALLVALSLLAGLISLMTKYIVDKPEEEEEEEGITESATEEAPVAEKSSDLQVVAAIAVALYRSQLELTSLPGDTAEGAMNSWQQFRLNRRLNQTATFRRTR
jgi:sodium pump decarboxylase gamma subunit